MTRPKSKLGNLHMKNNKRIEKIKIIKLINMRLLFSFVKSFLETKTN